MIGAVLFASLVVNATEEVLFVTESLPPLQFLEDGELKGEHTRLVKRLAEKAGLSDARIEVYPWARAYKMALDRKNTFIFSMVRTPERENKFIWIEQLGKDEFGFYGKKPLSQYPINHLNDAKNWLTVVLRQDLVFETLSALGFEERRHLIIGSDLNSVFRVFFSGRADLVVTNQHLFAAKASLLDQDPEQWGMIWTIPALTKGYYLAAQKDTDPELIKRLKVSVVRDQKQPGRN